MQNDKNMCRSYQLNLVKGAQRKLGDKFDIRKFHKVVLANGAYTLRYT